MPKASEVSSPPPRPIARYRTRYSLRCVDDRRTNISPGLSSADILAGVTAWTYQSRFELPFYQGKGADSGPIMQQRHSNTEFHRRPRCRTRRRTDDISAVCNDRLHAPRSPTSKDDTAARHIIHKVFHVNNIRFVNPTFTLATSVVSVQHLFVNRDSKRQESLTV